MTTASAGQKAVRLPTAIGAAPTRPQPVFASPGAFTTLRTIWRENDLASVTVTTAAVGSATFLAYALPLQHQLQAAVTLDRAPTFPQTENGGTTTFVFQVPDGAWGGTALPNLTDDQLLDWSALIPVLAPNAASTADALNGAQLELAQQDPPGASDGVTAVWLPGLLAFSPDERAWWAFTDGVVTRHGRAQIWQARLEAPQIDPGASQTENIPVRAIDAFSSSSSDLPDQSEPLTNYDAMKLVWFTSVFSAVKGGGLIDPVTSLAADGVEVSMLGGSVDVRGDLPKSPDLAAILLSRNNTSGLASGLGSFRWAIDRGSDRIGAAEHTYRLKYWGHRVQITSRYQRVVVEGVAQWLSQSQQLHFLDRTLSPTQPDLNGASAFPMLFTSVTVLDKDVPALEYDDSGNTWAFGDPQKRPIMLHLRLTDRSGNSTTVVTPLYLQDLPPSGASSSELKSPPPQQTLSWSQRPLCLYPGGSSTPGFDPARTTFETDSVTVAAFPPVTSDPTVPLPSFAVVAVTARVPALRSLHASHPPVLTLAPVGPGTAVSFAGDTVYATITLPGTDSASSDHGIIWPPTPGRIGMSATNLAVDALSIKHGAIHTGLTVPAAAAAFADPQGGTADSIWAACTLLGFVPLTSLGITDPPVIASTRDGNEQTTTLSYAHSWPGSSPAVSVNGGVVTLGSLLVSIEDVRPLSGEGVPSTTTTETATDVVISLALPPSADPSPDADVVVSFDTLTFTELDGQRPSLVPSGQAITFAGQLAFVADLLSYLPSDMFSNPPQFTIDGDHATLRSTVGLPPFGVGAFSLSNVTLAAAVAIPLPVLTALGSAPKLTGAPSVEIDLASKDAPFTLSVGIVGGGGWFNLTVGTALTEVDAGLDFGGVFSFDIGIASGGVSLTGGVRLCYPPQNGVLAGGFVHLSGGVEVIAMVSVSIDVMLELDYAPDEFSGTAEVSVRISLLFVHKTISWSMSQTFAGSANTSSDDAIADRIAAHPRPSNAARQPDPPGVVPTRPIPPGRSPAWSWQDYAAAFLAPVPAAES